MLIAAVVFGLLGGLVGLLIGTLVFLGDLVAFAFSGGDAQARGILVLLFSLVAIAGAFVSLRKPWWGALALVLSGAGCMVAINIFGAPVLFFTLLAAFSAIRGRREVQR